MNKKKEFIGWWWVPEDPSNYVTGTLKYTPNKGATLNLIGTFRDEKDYPKLLARRIDFYYNEIILGLSNKGELITLYGCRENPHGFSYSKAGIFCTNQPFSVNYIFLGHHFKKVEDINFYFISVNYSYLDEWVNRPLNTQRVNDKFFLELKQTELIQLVENDDYKICIGFDFSSPMSSLKDFSVKQKAFFLIEFFKEQKWTECLEIIKYLQDFLTIATTKTVYPLKIRVKNKNYMEKITGDYTHHPYIDVIICYSKIPESFQNIISYNMLFAMDDIKERIEYVLPTWFSNSRESKMIYYNYFATIYGDKRVLEDHFLNIIIALESYHRKNFDNFEMDPFEHEKRVKNILKIIPNEYKSWVEFKLKYNEPNLRKRLVELIKDYFILFGGKSLANKFLDQAVEIRNKELIHKNKDNSSDSEKLYYIMELLKFVFEICLLNDMGFNINEITGFMEKKKKLMNVVFEFMGMNKR